MQREANMAHARILPVFATTIDLPLQKPISKVESGSSDACHASLGSESKSAAGTLVLPQALGRESWNCHP